MLQFLVRAKGLSWEPKSLPIKIFLFDEVSKCFKNHPGEEIVAQSQISANLRQDTYFQERQALGQCVSPHHCVNTASQQKRKL